MPLLRRSLSVLSLGSLTLLSACGCNLVGCFDGLTVALSVAPVGGYRVEARVLGSPAAFVFECPADQDCGARAFFADFTPEVAFITVITSRGTVQREVRPGYTTQQPNGKGCEPRCMQGTVTVESPT